MQQMNLTQTGQAIPENYLDQMWEQVNQGQVKAQMQNDARKAQIAQGLANQKAKNTSLMNNMQTQYSNPNGAFLTKGEGGSLPQGWTMGGIIAGARERSPQALSQLWGKTGPMPMQYSPRNLPQSTHIIMNARNTDELVK
jgi:hypothetical protein